MYHEQHLRQPEIATGSISLSLIWEDAPLCLDLGRQSQVEDLLGNLACRLLYGLVQFDE